MSRRRSLASILDSEYVSIGELVQLTGSRYSTLKFYTEEGMLPFIQADEGLVRRFPLEASIARIKEIQALKAEGHNIPTIKALLCAKA